MSAEWGKISSKEIAKAISGRVLYGDPRTRFSGFNSDSRTIGQGEVFWAIKGDRFDGHDFVSRAAMRGASGVVIQKEFQTSLDKLPNCVVITVGDTLRALGDLATWWRRQHRTKVAAITGSSGKTTAKEMTAAILHMGNKTLKNPGNHNNLIGLPITLLKLAKEHRRAVLEMGMNRKGEIARLTKIANPDAAVILNIGMAHLEGLGDMDGVAEAKTEIIGHSSPDAKIILNGDDEILMKHAARFHRPHVKFGFEEGNDVQAKHIRPHGSEGIAFDLVFEGNVWPVHLRVPGIHNIKNALAAAAIALCFEEPAEHIVKGLGSFKGVKGRFQNIPLEEDVLLIDDSYNANPSALRAALHSAAPLMPKDGRLLVGLGDMLELGEAAIPAHREAGERVARSGASWFFVMGSHAKQMKEGAMDAGMPSSHVVISKTHDELTETIIEKLKPKDMIFLKGSRKMQFEKVSEGLQRHFGLRSANS
ncbi:MAG: UDP-N-acetylmuramoyl-tripeptide--D-alanyl-D-alanine ligase [Deltaproteobacteria bacterium]|nr:UDP-N-acetylmuramoyl-tripeptide--D-alanyl-D-alanine ligase [Deltaproteobacteria bacterium]